MKEIINKLTSLRGKIVSLIDHDFEMFQQYPHLCNFIHSELQRDPERLLESVHMVKVLKQTVFERQLKRPPDGAKPEKWIIGT